MARVLRTILLSTLGTTSGKPKVRTFSSSSKERGCLPWETSVKKHDPLKDRCKENVGLQFVDGGAMGVKMFQRKNNYPLGDAMLMKPIPGAPVPDWKAIQKKPPKKPENC